MAYKTGWLKKVINGVSTKIFSFAHVKTVYTDYENGKLLSDKLTEIDDDIAEINSNLDELKFGEVAGGKNICKASDNGVINEITLIKKDVSTIIISGAGGSRAISKNFNVKKGVTYTATFFTSSTNVTGFLWNSIKQVTAYSFGSSKTITFTSTEDETLSFAVTLTATVSNVEISIQVEEGSKSTSFEPYIPSVKMLAEENTQIDDLNVLGWVVPEEMPIKNYTDSYGVFHQIVGRVDLGTLNWTYDVPNTQFYTDIISQIKQDGDWIYDVYCSKYITASYGDKRIALNRGRIYIGDSSYTDVDSLKHSLLGVYLYFELSTPITMTIDGNEAVTKVKNDLSESKSKLDNISIDTIDRELGEIVFKGIGFSAKLTLLKIGNQLELLRGQIHTVGNFFSVTSKDELSFDLSVSEFGDHIKGLKMTSKLAFSGQGIFASKVIGMIYFREYTSSSGDKGIKVTLGFNDSYEFSSANVRSGMVQFDF